MQALPETLNELHVVAVGASAGGLEAIHEFFDNLPDSTHLSFIVIQHLSSDYKSLLVELVSKHTHMQVQEAQHQMLVQAGCVYVIPNDKVLTIQDGCLLLAEKGSERGPNLAIDTFLFSLAEDQKERAIAVILSGTGTDGTRGAEAIKEHGGLVLVQDPFSAKFDGMPKSVIGAHLADFVLKPEAMAEEIYNYLDGHSATVTPMIQKNQTEVVSNILNTVYKHTGYDFHQYKPATILRRISRRMVQTKRLQIKEYEEYLNESPDESQLLSKEFFIGVTNFFRDKDAFEILYSEVFPNLVASKKNGDIIKIWVTACSFGQEAYSIAILLDKFLQTQEKVIEVKVFATDIDESAIAFACKGHYPLSAISNVDKDILNTYFIGYANEFIIIPRLRKQIVFARHNILKDPPFIKNDLITCRNLLIYLNSSLQQNVLSALNFALKKDGFLFLGPSENPAFVKSDLEEVNAKWKIYKKITNNYQFSRSTLPAKTFAESSLSGGNNFQSRINTASQLTEDFKKVLADELGYAAVYINDNYEIKEVIGDFRRYLSLPDKIQNLNILKMVPIELSGILSTAFRKVNKENKKATIKNVRVTVNGAQRIFNVIIQPPQFTSVKSFMLVIFGELAENIRSDEGITEVNLLQQNTYIQELENELKETRANLQMAIEGLETTNEELQSSNEELQSANEELQSSNEELQSLNEELHTLNTEHQLRIKELVELNDDLNNYFRSTEIAQILLDKNLNIRRFNPVTAKIINIIESDLGRPIDNISNNLKNGNLVEEVKRVMQNNQLLEKEVEATNGSTFLMRILPYLRQDKKSDGVVVSFIDVSVIKKLNSVVKGVFDTTLNGILVFESVRNNQQIIENFVCTAANQSALDIFNKSNGNLNNQLLKNQFPALMEKGFFTKCVNIVEENKTLNTELGFQGGKSKEYYNVVANKLNDGFIITFSDITQRKEAEEKLRKNYAELLQTKESLKQLNDQLEVKVQERTKDLTFSEERFRMVASATNDAIWDWNFAENSIWWSESFYNLFQYDKQDEHLHSVSFWFNSIHPDDRQQVKDAINQVINGNQKQWSASYRFKKSDGSYAIILDRGTVMHDEFGTPFRMLGAMMDISQAEESAIKLKDKNHQLQSVIEEFRFVTDFIPQMVWSTRPDGNHDFFNKRWFDYTGMSYEETKDYGWSKVLFPEDLERTLKKWNHSVKTGKPYEIEYRLRRFDGQFRWFLGRAMALKDGDGTIVKWFGTCTDIHDQKMESDILEQKVQERTMELKKANADLEASNDELMQFASVASHDLQEPLRKIHMFSTMVKERYLNEASNGALDYMNRIITASSRATKLINDLLSFSRLSSEVFFSGTDLNKVVGEVISDIELAITDKKAKVEVEELPVIEAIPGQMRQVFQNLITNALKFNRSGVTPHVKVKSALVDSLNTHAAENKNGKYCRIIIKDNGIGFDQHHAQKIFTIFQRLHSREKYDGTGIGLAIAKKIVERHNGIINAFSKENEGAEFVIVLPLKQSAQDN